MINFAKKADCCGCAACVQCCPKQCITMSEDEEGFLYPNTDASVCVNCGLCEKVCPVINKNKEKEPIAVYATQHADRSVRLQSSSGGIFTLIADNIIEQGGVVFGARWDENLKLIHDYTETKDGLAELRSSKYVQSYIGESYKKAEAFLKQDRKVLFCGVACQIAGLKNYLRKDYENLFTIDVLCHGVPSPGVWKQYLLHIGKGEKITDFNFRNKKTGWKDYCVSYTLESGKVVCRNAQLDEYWRGFLSLYMTRPSCYECPAKSGKCGSDLTLGDLWGAKYVSELKDDDTGLSFVAVNSEKGKTLIESFGLNLHTLTLDFAHKHNDAYYRPTEQCPEREIFWKDYQQRGMAALVDMNTKRIGKSIKQIKIILIKAKILKILQALHLMKY